MQKLHSHWDVECSAPPAFRKDDTPLNRKPGGLMEQIKRWFWCSAFSQAYEKSPNTQSGRDVSELIPWLSDSASPAPENVRSFHFNPEQLRDVTPRQRSLYRATHLPDPRQRRTPARLP